MSINSVGSSGLIAGDKEIPAHLKKLPLGKSEAPCENIEKSSLDKSPLDINQINKLPGGCFGGGIKQLFNKSETIIDNTLSDAHNKMFGAQGQALKGFYSEIKGMDQNELDDMKDTLVQRMGSDDSSQWDRNLLQKMYEITDAVAEHRTPPHVRDHFEILPYNKPHMDFEDIFKHAVPLGGVSVKF